ncbi:MAG: hypothetical protein R3F31_20675 [Verrucomicrobiales bacterium]
MDRAKARLKGKTEGEQKEARNTAGAMLTGTGARLSADRMRHAGADGGIPDCIRAVLA